MPCAPAVARAPALASPPARAVPRARAPAAFRFLLSHRSLCTSPRGMCPSIRRTCGWFSAFLAVLRVRVCFRFSGAVPGVDLLSHVVLRSNLSRNSRQQREVSVCPPPHPRSCRGERGLSRWLGRARRCLGLYLWRNVLPGGQLVLSARGGESSGASGGRRGVLRSSS